MLPVPTVLMFPATGEIAPPLLPVKVSTMVDPPIPESSILFLERVDVIGGETWIVFHPEVEDLDVQFRPVEEVFLEPMEW